MFPSCLRCSRVSVWFYDLIYLVNLHAHGWTIEYELQYILTLVASDSLNENHTKIIISVRDVNDLPPVFPQKNYTYTMDEEIAPPFRFLQVKQMTTKVSSQIAIIYYIYFTYFHLCF